MEIQKQEQLLIAWREYVKNHEVYSEHIRPMVLDSWKRCRLAGVNPYQKFVPGVLNPLELSEKRRKNATLLEISIPIMEGIYQFVAGSGFVVCLADSEGTLLEVIGDNEVNRSIAKGNFVSGASWLEESAGTNSIGTVLVTGEPVQIFGHEHYCINSHGWTCSAAPIRHQEGNIIGVLDMTGSFEKAHPHTLGMVVAGAQAIEKQLSMELSWRERELANRLKVTIMDAISDCLIACDDMGIITHISRSAAELFGISPAETIGKKMVSVLGGSTNTDFCGLFSGKSFITDQEKDLYPPQGRIKCIVTTRPVKDEEGKFQGVVAVFNEIARAKRLVQHMSGAVARLTFDNIIGQAPAFLQKVRTAKAAARSDSTVLLLGESGTGKDVFAQAIHNFSSRSKGPFVAINCAAIPRELIVSELFGYNEGAFTGAKRGGSPGKFELADKGTLFLDEIGEMPTELQTMFLRVLEHKSITRIGGSQVIPVDVRIIAATNKDLAKEAARGMFRQDLYYRLNVLSIWINPLRDRKEDILPLAKHFLNQISSKMGREPLKLEDRIIRLLESYDWKGNVRELQNTMERAMYLAQGEFFSEELLAEDIRQAVGTSWVRVSAEAGMDDVEREQIKQLLLEHKGNITRISSVLRVARTTLYRRMRKLNISRNA